MSACRCRRFRLNTTASTDVTRFFATFMRRRVHDLVPARANGQPAFGAYLRASTGGIRHGTGLFVLTLAGDRISGMTRFRRHRVAVVRLPQSLPQPQKTQQRSSHQND